MLCSSSLLETSSSLARAEIVVGAPVLLDERLRDTPSSRPARARARRRRARRRRLAFAAGPSAGRSHACRRRCLRTAPRRGGSLDVGMPRERGRRRGRTSCVQPFSPTSHAASLGRRASSSSPARTPSRSGDSNPSRAILSRLCCGVARRRLADRRRSVRGTGGCRSLSLTRTPGGAYLLSSMRSTCLPRSTRRGRRRGRRGRPTRRLSARMRLPPRATKLQRAAPRGAREDLVRRDRFVDEELAEAGDALGAAEQEEARMVQAVVKRGDDPLLQLGDRSR